MQTKGKGSKVLVADRKGQEPVIDIPEGKFSALTSGLRHQTRKGL